jgi:NAD(P)-dependent dehydrogenase (short-subunit alcohol dehydrogenase family)
METGVFGNLAMTRAFAPVLTANGGGAILNVLPLLAWLHLPDYGAYSAAPAQTNVVRRELALKGIEVTGLHVGYMDTDLADYVDPSEKSDPAVVASAALDGVAAGETDVLADEITQNVRQQLSAAPAAV